MSRITEDNRWWCHACSTAFREPIPSVDNDPPLCPNCMSEVIEQRELDAPEDEAWFQDHADHADHEEEDHPFPGFFNPPSMVGNRQSNRPQPQMQEINPLAEMLRLISGGMSAPSNTSSAQQGGPRIRTFTFGNPAGGGIMGGATISIGGGSVLGQDNQGFVRDPWGDAFGQSRGGRTADEAARERFGDGDGGGTGQGYDFRPAPGDYVTIEDLLSHFLGGMTVAGIPGNGQMGDYVMSDEGLDRVLEQLMHAAGEHNRPPPASDLVIEGLPRIKLDEATLEASQYKDCSVCLTEFELGQEVTRIPCKHIFHSECLVPWLKQNGTCPVCRFSLVPEEQRSRPHPQSSGDHASGEQGAGGIISNVFQGVSRFFLGGEDQHHEPDHAHSDVHPTEGNPDSARHEGTAASRPPGSFPRAVSPTVDEHPDQAVHDLSNRTAGSGFGSTSGGQGSTDERPSARPSSQDHPPHPVTPSDSQAAVSSTYDRSSTLVENSIPASSSTEDRGSGDSSAERQVSRSSAPQDGAEHARDTSTVLPSSSAPNTPSPNQSNDQPSPNKTEPSRHHSPHPIYPTLIPAEHLQRHARREAELREAQERRHHQMDESGGD